jgi:hypothetical protein
MDTDLSHEALERFTAIENRLDALEGSSGVEDESTLSEGVDEEEADREEFT